MARWNRARTGRYCISAGVGTGSEEPATWHLERDVSPSWIYRVSLETLTAESVKGD